MTKTYQDFRDQIAEKETSYLTRPDPQNSYTTVNQFGYVGKYQMGESALIDAGYYKAADGNGAGASIQIAIVGYSTHPTLANTDFTIID